MTFARFSSLVALIAFSLSAPAFAQSAADWMTRAEQDPAERVLLIKEGQRTAEFCGNCHGNDGNSPIGQVPNLASQHPVYLLNQIRAFADGQRKDPFMEGLMRVLSEREKASITLFLSSSVVRPASAQAGPRAQEGKQFYEQLCARCHGDDALGGAEFPRLAGQQREYLQISLDRYLTMSGERIYPPMTWAVTQLGEKNFDAMIDYLSSLER